MRFRFNYSPSRYRRIGVIWLFCLGLLQAGAYAGEEGSRGAIEVRISGIKSRQHGNLILTLYDNEDSWLEPKLIFAHKVVEVLGDMVNIRFEDIPYGNTYALFIFHDKNKNEKLVFRCFPFPRPREGVAVSNNAGRAGPPYYHKALLG